MQELFIKYLNNHCSPEEVKELLAHFNIDNNENVLRALIIESLETADANDDGSRWNPATDEVFAVIKKQLAAEQPKSIPIFKRSWIRVAAAAIFLVAGFSVFQLINNKNRKQEMVKADASKQEKVPGNDKAILTLADGSTIILETVVNGELTQQGNTKILKPANGQLVYQSLNEKPTEALINSITTPRGGRYQLTLADGSRIWLNAASTLRFPAAFAGSERKVQLSGEAYFEVTKNVSMPFKVEVVGKAEVEVLGTHFNINAYSDEATINTTLLEGRVKIMVPATGDSRILTPGDQASLQQNGQISIQKIADAQEAMAWKNGVFHFSHADLGMVLRQLSRWYDVDVLFEGAVPKREFNGDIQRDLKLWQVLKLLEKNNVYSRVEGRTLIILK